MKRRAALSVGRQQTGDPKTDELWRAILAIVAHVNASPLSSGRLITEEDGAVGGSGLAFVAATRRSIPHKLGRPALGILEVYGAGVPSAAHVGLFAAPPADGKTVETHVTVEPTATGTCWLWVFG